MKLANDLKLTLFIVGCLWAIYFLGAYLPAGGYLQGIQPRRINNASGILTAPLIHGNIQHLSANSGALFVLLLVSLTYSRRLTVRAVIVIILLGGGLVWLLAKPGTVHIGASGVVFGLIGFLMFSGLVRREWRALLISVVVGLFYGSTLLSLLRFSPGISWSSHLYGFTAGVVAAWSMRQTKR
jgi:membrane associated rhomboid family serine protease